MKQFVALSFVAQSATAIHQAMLTIAFGLKFGVVSIPAFILRLGKSVLRQFAVAMMLPSYPLDLWKVGHISTVDLEQRNFIPK